MKGGYIMDRFTESMLVKKVKNSGRAKILLDELPNFFGSEEEFKRIVRKHGFTYSISDNFVYVKRS